MSIPTLPGEEWHPVPGYEGRYAISSLGRVYSYRRHGDRPGGFLKPVMGNRGYYQVNLGFPCERHQIHVLVCLVFFGPRPDRSEIRHLNGDKTDCRVQNLRYGTQSENSRDRVLHGTHNMASKTHCKRGHEFTPETTYITAKGSRQCRSCLRIRYHERKQEAAA